MSAQDYTLPRGEVHFSRFKPGTQIGEGFRYLGNSPEYAVSYESEKLDHFNSDRGIREKDKSITVEVNRTGNLVLDEITLDNLSMFMLSAEGVEDVTATAASVVAYAINGVKQGRSYQLGKTESNPIGAMNITYPGASGTLFSVKDDAVTPVTFVAMTDYVLDAENGLLYIVPGGGIENGDNLRVNFSNTQTTYHVSKSGSEAVEGELMYITKNPTGKDYVYRYPWVSIAPNGDLNMKGDEWQQIPFTIEILRKAPLEATYLNDKPFAV